MTRGGRGGAARKIVEARPPSGRCSPLKRLHQRARPRGAGRAPSSVRRATAVAAAAPRAAARAGVAALHLAQRPRRRPTCRTAHCAARRLLCWGSILLLLVGVLARASCCRTWCMRCDLGVPHTASAPTAVLLKLASRCLDTQPGALGPHAVERRAAARLPVRADPCRIQAVSSIQQRAEVRRRRYSRCTQQGRPVSAAAQCCDDGTLAGSCSPAVMAHAGLVLQPRLVLQHPDGCCGGPFQEAHALEA